MNHLRRTLLTPYHYAWAVFSTLWYRHPARRLTVVGVTGTKGKSSVAEMLHVILTEAGYMTALAGTIHFKIGKESRPNLFKMTLPGRGFIQKFLAEALQKGCTHAVVEITSESTLQYRNLGLDLDALIFTNIQKEHIESHGSFENYFKAKLSIGESLVHSPKRPRAIVANIDDEHGRAFLALAVENSISFSATDAKDAEVREDGVSFSYNNTVFSLPQPGAFSIMNALAAVKAAHALGVPPETCARALAGLARIEGRVERINAGQDFLAIVDYAHTPDSLRALYTAFEKKRKICVLGNTGGGRDTWKRPEMAKIAEEYCDEVILTNEDPYDEDPQKIVQEMADGMKKPPTIIMDRREAIRHALASARTDDVVLISGKGTDPYIMGAHGTKTPWSDAEVTEEELRKLLAKSA